MKALVAQSCPTLGDRIDYSPPGPSVHGIFQAKILEWAVIPFSRESPQLRDGTQVSHIVGRFFIIWITREALIMKSVQFSSVQLLSGVWLFATPWIVVYHASPSMGFSRQEYWSGVPLPSPWLKSKTVMNTGDNVEQQKLSFIVPGNVRWYSYCYGLSAVSPRNWYTEALTPSVMILGSRVFGR